MASLNTFECEPSPVRTVSRGAGKLPLRLARMVKRAREGDRESFDELVKSHQEGLRSFLAHRVEASEVDDVIQDVFVAAWRALPSYDGRSQFRTWLFAIAFNKVRDHYRQKMRRISEVYAPNAEAIVSDADPFSAKDLSLSVRQLLTHLSESQHEVILLYYQDELTLAEIANVLNRNLSTVKYQFFQAHAKLADHIRSSPEWSAWITPSKKAREEGPRR
jgi:RNA polymerase sigma-70 factor (ECF subfamily)